MLTEKINKLKKKSFRDAYVRSHLTHGIAHQIRDLRKQRGWSQSDLANKLGVKSQSTIARMEDPSYGNLSMNTLLKLSSVFDVALSIRFQSYGKFLFEREDLSEKAMQAEGFEDDKIINNLSYHTHLCMKKINNILTYPDSSSGAVITMQSFNALPSNPKIVKSPSF